MREPRLFSLVRRKGYFFAPYALLLACIGYLGGCGAAGTSQLKDFRDFTKEQQLEDFSWLIAVFDEQYALTEFKEKKHGFQFEELVETYRQKIENGQGMDRARFTDLLQQFVATMRDAHTSTGVLRDIMADGWQESFITPGFVTELQDVDGGQQAVISRVLDGFFPGEPPVQVGDQLLEIDGRSPDSVVEEDIRPRLDLGHPVASRLVGFSALTMRSNYQFALLPAGPASLLLRRDGREFRVTLEWLKVSWQDAQPAPEDGEEAEDLWQHELLQRNGNGSWIVERSRSRGPGRTNLGNRYRASERLLNFRQRQGMALRPLLETDTEEELEELSLAGIAEVVPWSEGELAFFLVPEKGLAVYRVGDFMTSRMTCSWDLETDDFSFGTCENITGEAYAEAFNGLKKFGIKKLVLDLRGNGGGYLDTVYELVRGFSGEGFPVNNVRVRLNEEWLADMQLMADNPDLPVLERQGWQRQLAILKEDATAGRRLSRPVSVLGRDRLPGIFQPFDGEIFILTDELCASACDIFATTMQDLGLGKVVGARSMGAGGNVIYAGVAPHVRMELYQTVSVLYRRDGSAIENAGAAPDRASCTRSRTR